MLYIAGLVGNIGRWFVEISAFRPVAFIQETDLGVLAVRNSPPTSRYTVCLRALDISAGVRSSKTVIYRH